MPSYSSGGVIVDAIDPQSSGALAAQIGSIVSVDIQSNVETIADDSGSIYDEGRAITQVAPVSTVSSKSIAEVLAVIGVTGQCFIDGAGAPGVIIYGKNRGDCLTDVEADEHSAYTFSNGLLYLNSLQADKGSDAVLGFTVDGIYDGTNIPLIINHAATLPATLIKAQYEIGLCAIGGSQFKPESVTIDFGIQITKPRGLAPNVYPERIAVMKASPVFTFRGIDPTTVTGLLGGLALHANTKVQLLKRLTGSTYEAAATPLHISFTTYGLVIVSNPFSAAGQADATVDIQVHSQFDGTNAPILFNTATTYDTTPEA